jgi:hypothetical protein
MRRDPHAVRSLIRSSPRRTRLEPTELDAAVQAWRILGALIAITVSPERER